MFGLLYERIQRIPDTRRGEAGEETYKYTATSTQRLRNEVDGFFGYAQPACATVLVSREALTELAINE